MEPQTIMLLQKHCVRHSSDPASFHTELTNHNHLMCLTGVLTARRNARVARRAEKLETNNHQRLNENLLKIALKKRTSVNSLTDQDPTRVVMEKKRAWEEELGRDLSSSVRK